MSMISSEVECLFPLTGESADGIYGRTQIVFAQRKAYIAGRTAQHTQPEIAAAGFELYIMSKYPDVYQDSEYFRKAWESLSMGERAMWMSKGSHVLESALKVAIL